MIGRHKQGCKTANKVSDADVIRDAETSETLDRNFTNN